MAVKAVVVPQTVQKNTQLLEVQTLGGYSYFYNLPENLTFESGKQYTLEVTIESGECHVTIGDITDWTETSPILGEALEDLPVFEVYDLYDRNGIRGMVISVDETGIHGYVVSFDVAELPFCTNITLEEETDNEDGMANMRKVMNIDPTLKDYPAMKWCMDKNTDGKLRWYLPARNELNILKELVEGNGELFISNLKAIGGKDAADNDIQVEEEYDWETMQPIGYSYYLHDMSSTLNWMGSFMRTQYGSWNSKAQDYAYTLRAFYKF